MQEAAVTSCTEPKRSIFAREFFRSSGLIDGSVTTRVTNQKSEKMSCDPISGIEITPYARIHTDNS